MQCGRQTCEECETVVDAKTFCPSCGRTAAVERFVLKHRNPFVAAILAFFIPGAGQIYNGQMGKAVLIFFSCWLVIPWLYGIGDAFVTAWLMDRGKLEFHPPSGYIVIGLLFFFMLLLGPFLVIKSLKTVHTFTIYFLATNAVKNDLLSIAQAAEHFASDKGSYPVSVSQLYFADPPYLQELSCDTTSNGYSYTCVFAPDGYSLTGAPADKTERTVLPTFIVTTGAHLSVRTNHP